MNRISSLAAISLLSAAAVSARTYNLNTNYAPSDFLDGSKWEYFTADDPTHGSVLYQGLQPAQDQGLASIQNGAFNMKVDTAQTVGQYRNSVRIRSLQSWSDGVYVLDFNHLPTGCSVWPAWWTLADPSNGAYPAGGEIDILETFGDAFPFDQATLHTNPGCSVPSPLSGQTGTNTDSTDCTANSANLGCGVQLKQDPSPSDMNSNGGGAYVMERDLAGAGIKVWYFNNQQKAQYLTGDSVDTSSFPTPGANFGNPCPGNFGAHNIIFDITLCGDAVKDGGLYSQNGQCTPAYGTCQSQVTNHGDSYGEAYFSVNAVKVFT